MLNETFSVIFKHRSAQYLWAKTYVNVDINLSRKKRILVEKVLFSFYLFVHVFPIRICLTFLFSCLTSSHYSKSQIFVQKFNFDKTPTFLQVFQPNFFWQFFSWNQSCQQLKKPNTTTFSRVFHPKKNWQFSREIKVEFLDKI